MRGLRRHRQAQPVVVDRGVRASLGRQDRVDRVGGQQQTVDAEPVVLGKHVGEVDLDADRHAEAKPVDLEDHRLEARCVEPRDLGVRALPIVVSVDEPPLVRDDDRLLCGQSARSTGGQTRAPPRSPARRRTWPHPRARCGRVPSRNRPRRPRPQPRSQTGTPRGSGLARAPAAQASLSMRRTSAPLAPGSDDAVGWQVAMARLIRACWQVTVTRGSRLTGKPIV